VRACGVVGGGYGWLGTLWISGIVTGGLSGGGLSGGGLSGGGLSRLSGLVIYTGDFVVP